MQNLVFLNLCSKQLNDKGPPCWHSSTRLSWRFPTPLSPACDVPPRHRVLRLTRSCSPPCSLLPPPCPPVAPFSLVLLLLFSWGYFLLSQDYLRIISSKFQSHIFPGLQGQHLKAELVVRISFCFLLWILLLTSNQSPVLLLFQIVTPVIYLEPSFWVLNRKDAWSEVAQSGPTPCDPMDYSPPGSSVHEIFQARALEWGCLGICEKEKRKAISIWMQSSKE